MTERPEQRTTNSRSLALALLTGGTLLSEVALTRALSISLFHHLAFLVVSTALLGVGAAGVAVSVSRRLTSRRHLASRSDGGHGHGDGPGHAPRSRHTVHDERSTDADRVAGLAALAFAVLLPSCFALAQLLAVEPLAIAQDPSQLLRLGLLYLLLAAPYFAAGLAVAALLDRFAGSAPRLYAADLLGAGAGSFLALQALSLVGSRGAIVLGAACGAASASLFLRDRGRWLSLTALVALLCGAPFADRVLPIHISRAKVSLTGELFAQILRDPSRTKRTAETSIARVDLVDFGNGARRLFFDAGVAAVRVPPDGFRPRATDATLAYELRPGARALVVGSGAGWEVAEALAFGATQVDAVEINPVVIEHVPAEIARDPRVRTILDEGRSFLERAGEPYGAIVMVHTISNAATSAGALHLAEDYLLTVEAMRTALDRLTPDGLLFITRPEAQLPRLLTTLTAALGVERPADHLVAWMEAAEGGPSFYAAVLASRAPIAPGDRDRILERIAERSRLRPVAVPGKEPFDPLIAGILAQRRLDELEAIAGHRLVPPADDRPFFHQRRRFFDLGRAELSSALSTQKSARMALEDQPFAELSALVLLLETTVIGGVLLVLPLLVRRRERPALRRAGATLAYFAALGLGFMLVEISLIQQLGLLLGRPAVAFATVFAGILAGAGAGSRLSERFPRPAEAPALAAAAALLLAFVLPVLLRPALGLPEPLRIAVALLVVLPCGLVLGMPFPLGLLRLQGGGGLVPWAFAANGIASIAGTVLALILATEIGFSGVLLGAAVLYAGARALFSRLGPDQPLVLRRSGAAEPSDPPGEKAGVAEDPTAGR